MKTMVTAAAIVAMSVSAAVAESSSNKQAKSAGTGIDSQQTAAQKIKRQLEQAGFSNIKFLAKTFVVQAKSQDGDDLTMTFWPHGQDVFEAIDGSGSASGSASTTGSSNGSSPTGAQNRAR